jgi:hypothetical protein
MVRVECTVTRFQPSGKSEIVSSPTMIAVIGERASFKLGIDGKFQFELAVLANLQPDGQIALDLEHAVAIDGETDRLFAHRVVKPGTPLTVYGSGLSIIHMKVVRL